MLRVSRPLSRADEEFEELFKNIDRNGNGSLEVDELSLALRSLQEAAVTAKKAEKQHKKVADDAKKVSEAFDVVHEESGLSYRATFLIDKDGVVQSAVHNNLPLGRSMDELIRMVDALQFHEEHGEVCPANWQPGKAAMQATPEGVKAYLQEHASSL